ncbi:MAG: hypothetical protein E7439_02650 [Ruminococcaceae bacterium]|nr:hypothetical protein [Oscillospiraceae bacterium]
MKNRKKILDYFIRSSNDAVAFETLFQKAAIIFLIISVLLYAVAFNSIDYWKELSKRLTSLHTEQEQFRFRILCANFLIPAVSTSVLCVISFVSSIYAHRRCLELASSNKE